MTHIRIVVLGAFIALLCITAAMATPPLPDAAAADSEQRSATTAASLAGLGVCGSEPPSPVLDGGAFTNYDTIFYHGAAADANGIPNSDIFLEADYVDGHFMYLSAGGGGYAPSAFINCPFASYESKQGGIRPQVRYLGLLYRTTGAVIDYVLIYNGCTLVTSVNFDPPLTNSGDCTVRVIDLGGWYPFNRGLNMVVHVRNPETFQSGLIIGGYAARFEW